jgi:hypothetical protein
LFSALKFQAEVSTSLYFVTLIDSTSDSNVTLPDSTPITDFRYPSDSCDSLSVAQLCLVSFRAFLAVVLRSDRSLLRRGWL